MSRVNLKTVETNQFVILSADIACWAVPFFQFTSGMVLLQYGKFCCRQALRQSQLPFCLGTIAIALHLFQVSVDIWILFQSFQYYINGRLYTYYLYEALQTFSLAGIVLIVQYHFSRLASATAALSDQWHYLVKLLYVGTYIGGLGTAFEYGKHFYATGFDAQTPLVIYGQFLGFYITWLVGSGLVDGIITFLMLKRLLNGRSSVRHKMLRNTLSRLLNIIVNAFSLTFIIAVLSLIATLSPHIIPNFSLKGKFVCQAASFILTGLLPRIYLASFFSSFDEPTYFPHSQVDSCVASLGVTTGDKIYPADSLSPQQVKAAMKLAEKMQQTRVRVQVTHEVDIQVEKDIQDDDSFQGVQDW